MDFANFSGRDAIILAVIVIAVYLLVSLLRLSQVKRRRKAAAMPPATQDATPEETERAPPQRPAELAAGTPLAAAPSFEERLFRTSVEGELQQLRQEVAELREALDQLKAARRVAPQYNEAMLLAQRGVHAQVIADQCAISIGEAELVAALSRSKQEYQDHDEPYDARP